MTDITSLQKINVFSGLNDRDLADILRHLAPVHLDKGAHLFYRNDISTGLYLVYKGSVQIIIDNDDNKEIIVYTVKKGDIVGEMTLFSGAERSATAVALEECRLFKVKNSKFIDLMNLYPVIGVNLSSVLVDRLHEANAMIERLGMMDGSERVVHFLRALLQREGHLDEGLYHMPKKPTYRQISQRLGVSEKTVYRTMQSLVKSGDIQIIGRSMKVKKSLFDNLH